MNFVESSKKNAHTDKVLEIIGGAVRAAFRSVWLVAGITDIGYVGLLVANFVQNCVLIFLQSNGVWGSQPQERDHQ